MRFSFIVPTYNYGVFLEKCISSVCFQISNSDEIIIIDDGSTDNTGQIIESILQRFYDENIRYYYQTNSGPSAARNQGVRHARGEYIWFLDADDILADSAVKMMSRAVLKSPEIRFIWGGYRSVNMNGDIKENFPKRVTWVPEKNFKRYIFKKIRGLAIGSAVVKRDVFEWAGFPEGVHNWEDMVFFGHLFGRYPVMALPCIVLETNRHEDSLRNNLERIEESGLAIVDRLFDPKILSSKQMLYREKFLAQRYLSIFRTYLLKGKYDKAKVFYKKAISIYPQSIFRWSYLRKYLRCRLVNR